MAGLTDHETRKSIMVLRKRRSLRVLLLSAATAVAAVTSTAAVGAEAASPDRAAAVACSGQRADAASAAAMAARCGHRVEALSDRTPYAQVFANPGGTMTLEQTVTPRWARRADGSWTDVDTTLRRWADGTVAPVASVLPIAFSGGGPGPLARLAEDGHEIALSWPGSLPVPTLDGDTATYGDVLPDVDLRVTASALGFSEVLVVKTPAAAANPALREVRFGVATKGVTTTAAGGGVQARDAKGRVVFVSPAPMMWDAAAEAPDPATTAGGQAAGAGAPVAGAPAGRVSVMPVRVARDSLTIVPDQRLLTDPSARFPVKIDPHFWGGISGNAWTSLWEKYPNSSFWQNPTALNDWQTKGGVGAGFTRDDTYPYQEHRIRSIFRMNMADVAGKEIIEASFRIEQRHAWACWPAAKLWVTDPISPSHTWNNQPGWNGAPERSATTAGNRRVGGGTGCLPEGPIEFNVGHIVTWAAAARATELTLGLRAIDENNHDHWKRFNHAGAGNTPLLTVRYNTAPNAPDQLTVDGKACVSGGGWPFVATASPTLRARVTDADNDSMTAHFTHLRYDPARNEFVGPVTGSQAAVPNGVTAQLSPTGLLDGELYKFQVQSHDGRLYSPVAGDCEFQVDLTDPDPVTPSGDIYKPVGCPSTGCGSVGLTGRFTLASGSPDVTGYFWGFSDPPSAFAPADHLGGQAVVKWTPLSAGTKTLYVKAVDRAGRSATSTQQFAVAGPSPAVASWRLDDAVGSTALADETGNGRTGTLTGGTLGAPGWIAGGETVLSVDGTSSATAPMPVDTSRSFSVSAWVKLTDAATSRVAIHAARPGGYGSFYLMYHRDHNRFAVATPVQQTGPTAWIEAYSAGPPQLGVWTHLTGVYDAAAGQVQLYVDGRLTGTAGGAAIWSAPGPLYLAGMEGGGSRWMGGIAQIRVWDRVVTAAEVTALIDPTAVGNVGEWHLEDVGSSDALDISPRANHLTLYGGAVIPPSGAGKVNAGLRLNGTTAYAATEGPVLYTDQSYTVSAWVRLNAKTWSHVAVSQDGAHASAFQLGYARECDCWAFRKSNLDIVDAHLFEARGPTAATGVWTHLTGVYDANTRTISLHVNGAHAATTAIPGEGGWHAGGRFAFGRAWWNDAVADLWPGDIDEVQAYAGAHVPAAVGVAGSVIVAPAADTTYTQVTADGDNGAKPTLAMCPPPCEGGTAAERDAFVEFQVSGIPAGATNVRATLQVYSADDHDARVTAYRATGGAGGSGTWASRPPLGTAQETRLTVDPGFNSFDVSASVTGNGTYTFALLQDRLTTRVYWPSRENANTVIRPRLVVTYDPPS